MATSANHAPLVVVLGETATGKTELGISLAKRFNGEIIAADSWTVRRELAIGTAKPTDAQRRTIRHHLLDVADPCDDFSAALFKKLAVRAINDITARGKLPIMVGGTGLYIDGVVFDFGFLPKGREGQREQLNSLGIGQLVSMIQGKGLDLTGIDIRNKRRLIRVLETQGARPLRHELRPRTLLLGIDVPRSEVEERIAARTKNMIANGLAAEVATLARRYGWNCEALKGIGYKEWRGYFDGTDSLEDVSAKITRATTMLAKRQRTWFKRNKSIHWITTESEAVENATTFLNNY